MTLSTTRSLHLAPLRVNVALRFIVVSICAANAGVHVALVPSPLRESLTLGRAFALSGEALGGDLLIIRNPRSQQPC